VPYWQRDSWTDSDLVDSGYFSEESQSQAALCPRILGTAGLIYTARLPPVRGYGWAQPAQKGILGRGRMFRTSARHARRSALRVRVIRVEYNL
jgi:hypothetical protein